MNQKEYDKAITLLERLKTVKPDNPKVDNNLGASWIRKGEYQKAEQAYQNALKIDPDFTNGYFNLGILYERYLNDSPKALEMFKMYLDKGGEQVDLVKEWMKAIESKLSR